MDRKQSYFKQRITRIELNSMFDDCETGLQRLAKDLSVFGVVTGFVVTEHSPTPSMSVDLTGSANAYDQNGSRIAMSLAAVKDCSVDYLGNATVPTTAGQSRWISIHARFAREYLEPRTDGTGATVYWSQPESYELRVVAGAADVAPVRPAKPSDAVLLCDILLVYGQTSIVNADVYVDRRDDYTWTGADHVTVDPSAWTKILGSPAEVQTALDAIDTALVSRNGSGQVTQSLIPDATSRDLGASGTPWGDAFLSDAVVDACLARADEAALGDATKRFTGHFYDAKIYNSLAFNSARTVTKRRLSLVSCCHAKDANWAFSLTTVGARFGAFWECIADTTVLYISLEEIPHGATVTEIYLNCWSPSGKSPTFCIYRVPNTGEVVTIHNDDTGGDEWDEPEILGGHSFTVDRDNYHYYIQLFSVDGAALAGVLVTYTMTDIGIAALRG